MKSCTKCGLEKDDNCFSIDKRKKSGRQACCLVCQNIYNAEYRRRPDVAKRLVENRARYYRKPETRERDRKYRSTDAVKAQRKINDLKSPRHIFYATLRMALKRRPTENPATVQQLMDLWMAQNGRCAVSGIEMVWGKRQGPVPNSISMDRIDSNGGYSIDNLRLVCHAVNAFKGRMSDAEMLAMAKAIVANLNKCAEATWDSFLAFIDESNHMVLQ